MTFCFADNKRTIDNSNLSKPYWALGSSKYLDTIKPDKGLKRNILSRIVQKHRHNQNWSGPEKTWLFRLASNTILWWLTSEKKSDLDTQQLCKQQWKEQEKEETEEKVDWRRQGFGRV